MRDPKFKALATVIVCVFAVLAATWLAIFSEKQRQSRGAEITVSGRLQEWGTLGRSTSPALRFRLEDHAPDFRVDPALFRETMSKVIPSSFRRGAEVTVVVSEAQLRSPKRPLLNPETPIVWVRALTVDAQPIYGIAETSAWDRKNALWSYGLRKL